MYEHVLAAKGRRRGCCAPCVLCAPASPPFCLFLVRTHSFPPASPPLQPLSPLLRLLGSPLGCSVPPGMHPGSALPLPALSKGRGNRCQPACAAEPAQLLASGWQSSFGSFPCRDTPGHGADVLLHRLPNPTDDAASVQGVKPEQGSSAWALWDQFGICCLSQPSMYIADL